jgi:hypothetical protein
MANGPGASILGKGLGTLWGAGKKGMNSLPGGAFGKVAAGMTVADMYGNVQAGDDVGTAAVKAGANYVEWSMAPGPMTALTFGPALAGAAMQAGTFINRKEQWWDKQFRPGNTVGGNYMDSQRAQTMRQAAVQAIQGSKLNARSALGGEAQIFANNPYNRY